MKDASEKRVHLTCLHSQSMDQEKVSVSDQETVSESAITDKSLCKIHPRRTLDDGEQPLRSTVESISSLSTGKATDDGYNWRKYGQKLVKGSVCVRSYYKCTDSNCQAKRQVERSHDGPLTDIKYIGTHEHPKPLVSPLQVTATDLSVTSKSKAEDDGPVDIAYPVEPCLTRKPERVDSLPQKLVLQHNDYNEENPISKKPKIETFPKYDNTVRKTYCESRQVVQTLSEVDLIDDGYRWRKYGQKLVKGSPNPRSYYRCTKAGCEAKKHVERASHDSRIVITTYEGKHDHAMSTASREILNRSASESGADCTSLGGESRYKLQDHKPVEIRTKSGVDCTSLGGESRYKLQDHKPVEIRAESGVDCTSLGGESRYKLQEHKPVEIRKLVDVGVQTD